MTINIEKLTELIGATLELDVGAISIDSSSEIVEEWDSLGHLSILISLDKEFDGQIGAIKEMAGANSVRKIVSLLEENSLELK